MTAQTPYELLGEEGVRRLANTFYEVMDELPEAATIRAMHGASLDNIKQKLYEYLSGWMGGPALYVEKYGTFCLNEPHSHYAIGTAERDQWLQCMKVALERIDASDELKEMLDLPMQRIAGALRNKDH